MKSKESLYNIHLIKEDLKRFWPISLISFFALIIIKPLHALSIFAEFEKNSYSNSYYMTQGAYESESVILVCTAVFLSIVLFSYLHSKKSSGMIHAFPFTRKQLFHSHIISGVILLLAPQILNSCVLLIISSGLDMSKTPQWFIDSLSGHKVLIDLGYSFLSSLIFFLVSVFAGMISGMILTHVAFSFVFPFLPFVLIGLSCRLLENFVFGFESFHVVNNETLERILLPVVSLINTSMWNFKLTIWYLFICVLLYILSYVLYQKRNLEHASDPIVFNGLKQVFKYSLAFCAMCVLGLYLSGLFYKSNSEKLWLYIGMIFGSFLGYLIAEMVIQKSIWVFHKLKGYAIYLGFILIISIVIRGDLLGYEKRIPDLDKIQGVLYNTYYQYYVKNDINTLIDEEEDIIALQNIHKRILLDKNKIQKGDTENFENIDIVYILKNGKTISRNYDIPEDYLTHDENQKQIMESEQYKKLENHQFFSMTLEDVDKIEIRSNIGFGNKAKGVTITDPDEIKEVYKIIKDEILHTSYEDRIKNYPAWAYVSFELKTKETDFNNHDVSVGFQKYYTTFEEWLTKKDYIKNARVMPEDIEKIVVEEYDTPISREQIEIRLGAELPPETEPVHIWEIKDQEKIEEILRSYRYASYEEKHNYIVKIYIDGNLQECGYLTESALPSFIK